MSLRFLSLLAAMLLFIPSLAFTAPSYAGVGAVVQSVAVAALDTHIGAIESPSIISAHHIYDKPSADVGSNNPLPLTQIHCHYCNVNTASGNDSGANSARYRLALYQHVHGASCRHVSRDTPHLYIE